MDSRMETNPVTAQEPASARPERVERAVRDLTHFISGGRRGMTHEHVAEFADALLSAVDEKVAAVRRELDELRRAVSGGERMINRRLSSLESSRDLLPRCDTRGCHLWRGHPGDHVNGMTGHTFASLESAREPQPRGEGLLGKPTMKPTTYEDVAAWNAKQPWTATPPPAAAGARYAVTRSPWEECGDWVVDVGDEQAFCHDRATAERIASALNADSAAARLVREAIDDWEDGDATTASDAWQWLKKWGPPMRALAGGAQ